MHVRCFIVRICFGCAVAVGVAARAAAGPVVFTTQPLDLNVVPCRGTAFNLDVDGTGPFSFQWYSNAVPIMDATGRVHHIESATLAANGALFFAVVSNSYGAVTSRTATLTVLADVIQYRLLRARILPGGLDQIMLTFFGCPPDPAAAEDLSNYTINRGAEILGVFASATDVTIRTTTLQPGPDYIITVKNLTDIYGNRMKPNPATLTLPAPVFSPGFLRMDVFPVRGINAVACIPWNSCDPYFPHYPRERYYLRHADSRDAYPDNSHEGYHARLWGYFVPDHTTNYTFYVSSDDSSQLWLSTDESPANKVLLAEETGCCNPFAAHPSAPRALVAGQRYFLELIYREGTGGDYAQAAFKHTADPIDPNFLSPISGKFLGIYGDPTGASLSITQRPRNIVFSGASGTFPADFNGNNGGFTVDTPAPYGGAWRYNANAGSWQEHGQEPETGHPNTSLLNTPVLKVRAAGPVVLSFDHRYSQEIGEWDGGQVRVSVNGSPFTPVPNTAFTQNGYNGTVLDNSTSILRGQEAFVLDSPGVAAGTFITSIASLGTFAAGDTIRVQFVAGNDGNTAGPTIPNWEITSVAAPALDFFLGHPTHVTFSVGAAANLAGNPVIPFYQWYRDDGSGFAIIPGANSATYSFPPQRSDSGARFRALVSIPGATVTSSFAVLTAAAIDLRRSSNLVTLFWPAGGILQEATNFPAQWADRATAPNPFVISNGPTRFFRVRFNP